MVRMVDLGVKNYYHNHWRDNMVKQIVFVLFRKKSDLPRSIFFNVFKLINVPIIVYLCRLICCVCTLRRFNLTYH